MKKTRYRLLSSAMAIFCTMAMFTLIADCSYAASTVKVKSISGKTCTLSTGYTGYQYAAKSLKEGNAVKVKALSANSKYAKTITYGVKKGWTAKKLSDQLKKAKKYKISVPKNWKFCKVYRNGKLRYVALKQPAALQKVAQTAPAEQIIEKPVENNSEQVAETNDDGTLDISVMSDNTSFCTEEYNLENLKMRIASDEGYVQVASPDEGGDIVQNVPAGDYTVTFIEEADSYGAGAYVFSADSYSANVSPNEKTELDIMITPQPGYLYIYSPGEQPDRVFVTNSSGTTEEIFFEPDGDLGPLFGKWLPADTYKVTVESDGNTSTYNAQLRANRFCGVEM